MRRVVWLDRMAREVARSSVKIWQAHQHPESHAHGHVRTRNQRRSSSVVQRSAQDPSDRPISIILLSRGATAQINKADAVT